MKYFDHDTDACKDELVQALRLECGGAAVDAYWTILELIYRDETDLVLSRNQPGTKSVMHWLCIDWETFETYFRAMGDVGLLSVTNDGDGTYTIRSERAAENIEKYQARCETARENGKKGGRKPKRNRKVTESEPKANREPAQPKTKEKEKEKLLDSYKSYPNNSASDGAEAAGAAPPAAEDETRVPVCPLCSQPARFDPIAATWRCGMCGEIKEPSYQEVVT